MSIRHYETEEELNQEHRQLKSEIIEIEESLEYKNELVVPGDEKTTNSNALKKAKEIQGKWKKIGTVPKNEDKALWKRFQKAMNQFYTFNS